MTEKKKEFWVRVPFAGVVTVLVEAESIKDEGDAYALAMEKIDESGFHLKETHNKGYRDAVFCDEWEYHARLTSGNVLHVSCNEVEWDEA